MEDEEKKSRDRENRKRLSAFFINEFAIGMLAIVLVVLDNFISAKEQQRT